jgi:hypothetical protein
VSDEQRKRLAIARREAKRAGEQAGKELRWKRDHPEQFD